MLARSTLISAAFLLCLLSACGTSVPPDVAATVNGRPIRISEVDKAYKLQFPESATNVPQVELQSRRADVLRSLIDNELMFQRAEKEGLVATDADIEARLNELKAPYNKEEFDKQLKDWGLSLDELKSRIRRDESIKKVYNKDITSQIKISDADVEAFYNANLAAFNLREPEVHLAQILVTPHPDPTLHNLKNDKAQNPEEAKRKILALEARLKQGEDFAILAQNYSEDPKTVLNGGDLGFLPESSLNGTGPDLRRLILNLHAGEISRVIHTDEGYRVIKMISLEPAGQRDVSDPRVQEAIRGTLRERKEPLAKTAYYEMVRKQAKIDNIMTRIAQAPRAATIESSGSKNPPKFDLTKWKLHLDGVQVRGGLAAYFPLDDSDASAAVIEAAAEARTPEDVAYLALVRHKHTTAAAFVGGTIASAGNLVSVGVELSNSDQKPATFLVGDVVLVGSDGQKLRPVYISKGDSPMIAKFSDRAEAGSEAVPVTVQAGKSVRLNYGVMASPNSFPLHLQFGTEKTDAVLNDVKGLAGHKSESGGFSVSLGGQLTVSADVPVKTFEASVGQRGPVLRFESISLDKGDQLAASGSKSMDTLSLGHGPEVPLLQIFRGRSYIAGKLFVLKPITPVKTKVIVQEKEITFTNSFSAQSGDVLLASISDLADDGECVLSQYVVLR